MSAGTDVYTGHGMGVEWWVILAIFGLVLAGIAWGLIVKLTVRWVVSDLRDLGVIPAAPAETIVEHVGD